LIGFPGLSGFFSKDSIIETVHASRIAGSSFAYFSVLVGVFVTGLYSFRLFFLVFHGKERFEVHNEHVPHESPAVITVPLILLAIPSVLSGYLIGWVEFGDFFGNAIVMHADHDALAIVAEEYHGIWSFIVHGVEQLPFWLAMAGVATAYYLYMMRPDIPAKLQQRFNWLFRILDNKYGFDSFNQSVFVGGARSLGHFLWQIGDRLLIDGIIVNGAAKTVEFTSKVVRHVQSGYLYHYAFAMIIGLYLLLTFFVA
jgi:NADH-quinone oxidoreductase subunit L